MIVEKEEINRNELTERSERFLEENVSESYFHLIRFFLKWRSDFYLQVLLDTDEYETVMKDERFGDEYKKELSLARAEYLRFLKVYSF